MATRLYLCNATGLIPPVSPANAAWQESNGDQRLMIPTLVNDPLATVVRTTVTPGNTRLHRSWVSPPMMAGITFTSGVSTFTCQIQGLESAANDNVINRVRVLRVFNRAGTTVQATLIALGNATSVVEWSTALRNLTFLGATAVGATYTTIAGDLLVLETGHDDSAGVSISASFRAGADVAGTGDLGTNETDTTTTLRPWLESSVNLTFEYSIKPLAYPSILPQ